MEQNTTIESFFEENKGRLTSVGVFAALAGYFGSLDFSVLAYLLSFCMLTCLVLTWSEINSKPTKEEETNIRVTSFKFFLRWSYRLVIIYILLKYRLMSWLFLFVPIFLYMLWQIIKLLRKNDRIVKLFQSRKLKDVTISVLLILLVSVPSFGLAIFTSTIINYGLELTAFIEKQIEENFKPQNMFEESFQKWIQNKTNVSPSK